jgi:hypothetical protein
MNQMIKDYGIASDGPVDFDHALHGIPTQQLRKIQLITPSNQK